MVIKHIGIFNDVSTEGFMKVSNVIINDIDINIKKDIKHLHSSGIQLAIDNVNLKGIKIYSLYTNQNSSIYQKLKMLFYGIKEFGFKGRKKFFKTVFFTILSSALPLWHKRIILSNYNYVVVPTQYLANKIKLHNVRVIPFGIDTGVFSYKCRNNIKLVVSYLGSMTVEKGAIDYLRACQKVMETNNNIEFRIYIPHKFNNLINKDLLNNIKVLGKQNDIAKAYHDSDIVVIPHKTTAASIAIPLVMLEAMSCGCLVITTNLKHLNEVGSNCVEYVEVGDIDDIADKIIMYNEDRHNLKLISVKASIRIIKKYNKNDMLKKYNELYNEI